MGLPPGPVYVVKRLGSSLRACLLTYTLLWTLSHLEAFKSLYSSALLLLLSLLLHPVLNVAKRVFLKVKSQRQAANLGAVFPPSVPQSGYLIVQDMLKDFQSNYIGDLFLKWHALHGPTFMLQIYSEIRILTCEPAHLKTILATQANNFIKGTLLNQQWKSLLGSGVFIADGTATSS
ncbi:hypothetical protein L218DRAFT_958118 [Marasmius fiardii PR-910]|nr:hypothetical protein L218DRAFT_958118 [Marasmius fiardii PR-910]